MQCKGASGEPCREESWCRGYCARHYNQWRSGQLDVPFARIAGPSCTVDACDGAHIGHGMCHFGDGPHRAKGLCSYHYFRERGGCTPLEGAPRPRVGAKLTEAAVREIRHLHAHDGLSYAQLAKRFDVSDAAVAKAVQRASWKSVH